MATKRAAEWVVMGGKPGEIGYCKRCGDGLNINMPQRIEIVAACLKAFAEIHAGCPEGKYIEKPAKTPEEWAQGRDTGTSSLTIYSVMTGKPNPHGSCSTPWDPDDFGRCYRLLKLFPAWRERLPEVAKKYPKWVPLVREWELLTQLYEAEVESGTAPKLYAEMKRLLKEVNL